MSEERPRRSYGEKEEKQEKEEEKEEKNWEEKWRRDPLSAAAWALILIWLGLVLLAGSLEMFERLPIENVWPLFFLGAGAILILEVIIRLVIPEYRQPVRGNLVLAVVFFAIGLGGLTNNWNVVWAVAVIALGAFLLLSGLLRSRK